MPKQTIVYLKDKYETLDVPVEQNYADWLDSFLHLDDQGRYTLDPVVEKIYDREVTHGVSTYFDLFVDGVKLVVPASTAWNYEILIIGITLNADKFWSYKLAGTIVRGAGASISIEGDSRQVRGESSSSFNARCVTDNIDYALQVQVKDADAAGDIVEWKAYLQAITITK